jgi:hypothetical protein
MSFAYFDNIPGENNDPKVDQPRMKINTNSISSWIDVDHVGFRQINGGTHRVCSFAGFAAPSAPTGVQSVAYPAAGVADTTKPQFYFRNSQMILPLSLIKAYGIFIAQVGPSYFNQVNMNATITKSSNNYTLTVNSNIITGNSPGILVTASNPYQVNYAYNANVLQLFDVPINSFVTVVFYQI